LPKKRKPKDKWTITDWEKWLWKKFSEYIRLRDCLKTTGTLWKGICRTCGRTYRFEKLQAGHFIPGRTRAILFDEFCVHIQCYRCNHILQGNWPPYYRFMQQEYGQKVIEDLVDKHGVDVKLNRVFFEKAYEYYSWAVDYMRENQQLVDSDTSKIATHSV